MEQILVVEDIPERLVHSHDDDGVVSQSMSGKDPAHDGSGSGGVVIPPSLATPVAPTSARRGEKRLEREFIQLMLSSSLQWSHRLPAMETREYPAVAHNETAFNGATAFRRWKRQTARFP